MLPEFLYHPHRNKSISHSRRFYDVHLFVLDSESFEFVHKETYSRMGNRICYKKNSWERGEACVSNLYPWFSSAQHIHWISPQNAENGDPKVLKSGWPEIPGKPGFVENFHRNAQSGKIREIHFGDAVLVILGGIFWGKWEWPKLIFWAGVIHSAQNVSRMCMCIEFLIKKKRIRMCFSCWDDMCWPIPPSHRKNELSQCSFLMHSALHESYVMIRVAILQ